MKRVPFWSVLFVCMMILVVGCGEKATTQMGKKISRFIAYDNGTVLDTQTNLMWAAKDNGTDIDWSNAKIYCDNYRGGGYADWRLPMPAELAQLYDESISGNNGYRLTTYITLTNSCPWASETHGSDAALVSFYKGNGKYWFYQPSIVSDGRRALPVRSVVKSGK